MDIFAHILWTFVIFYGYDMLWLALIFSILPDIITFGLNFISMITTGKYLAADWKKPENNLKLIPGYVFTLYDITHSLIVFSGIFAIAWILSKSPPIYLLAWLMHIIIDIPTHTKAFFPVRLFYPLSNFSFGGISWGTKRFMIANYSLLSALIIIRFAIWV